MYIHIQTSSPAIRPAYIYTYVHTYLNKHVFLHLHLCLQRAVASAGERRGANGVLGVAERVELKKRTKQYKYISFYLCMYVCIYLSIYPSIHPSIYLPIYLSIYLSIWRMSRRRWDTRNGGTSRAENRTNQHTTWVGLVDLYGG